MTTRAADTTTRGNDQSTATQSVPMPPKFRRRPALIAAAVAAICAGALLGAWAWTSTTNTTEVLAARDTIERGSLIEVEDLQRVRIGTDPALKSIPGSSLDDIVGSRAALDIAAGSLLTSESTTTELLPPAGKSVVGVALTAAQAPGVPLKNGDRVRVVLTPGEGADPPSGSPTVNEAEIVGTHTDRETGGLVVDLLVPEADAAVLAARVATGNIALVLDSGER